MLTVVGYPLLALVGNHLEPSGLKPKTDGTKVNTLWGELAWQLGGHEAYEIVAEADRTSTNPGDSLRELLAKYAPALILIDEWVAYARQLYGRDDLPGGSFDTQFTFAQTLTETAKAVPGVLAVISIPASARDDDGRGLISEEEVGGENGREALRRLQNIVRRVADQWKAANAEESFEIVRRRLFTTPDGGGPGADQRHRYGRGQVLPPVPCRVPERGH
jgi:predicted AAA+ superfamily ATPase